MLKIRYSAVGKQTDITQFAKIQHARELFRMKGCADDRGNSMLSCLCDTCAEWLNLYDAIELTPIESDADDNTPAEYATIRDLCWHLNAMLKWMRDRWNSDDSKIQIKQDYDNLTASMPSFGGAQPTNMSGIYSWSAQEILIWTGQNWAVVYRDLD